MSLLALQRDFAAALRRKTDMDGGAGLAVYRNNYRASLAACLEDSFAKTRDWIGGEAFATVVARHVDRVPPSSWTLDVYPRDFPDTLQLLYPGDPEVAELAWLESALDEAFVAPDAAPVSAETVAATDWDRAILRLTSTLDLRDITTNAPSLWSAMAADETPPASETLPEAAALLVWRQDHVSRFRTVDQIEAQAIHLARSGRSFAQLCEMLVASRGEEAGIVLAGTLLGRWLGDGLITAITEGE
jgi:hypothetical protein